MDFAIDPSLFGVAGPSTSATGRVRDVPSLLAQHELESASRAAQMPLLSDSESSESGDDDEDVDDEEEDEEEDEDDDDEDEDAASSSEADGSEEELDGEQESPRLSGRDKGKGRARGGYIDSGHNLPATALPPMPSSLPPLGSAGEPLPPLPPGIDTSHLHVHGEADDPDVDYITAGRPGVSFLRTCTIETLQAHICSLIVCLHSAIYSKSAN